MKKYLFIIFFALIFAGCQKTISLNIDNDLAKFLNKPAILGIKNIPDSDQGSQSSQQNNPAPAQVNLKVPFFPQAPLGNWDDLHNDACEETSILQVVLYLDGRNVNKNEANNDIIQAVNWQIANYGGHYELPAEKVKEFTQAYYKKTVSVTYDISIDSIKAELAKGNPVIVPLAGRMLNNPNFRSPGPVYHMLVIRGYDDATGEFITNDVGTKRGENYRYKYQTLFAAIHDMPQWQMNRSLLDANPDFILSGRKAMVTIK